MKVFQTEHVNINCCYTQFISCRIVQLKTNQFYYSKFYGSIQNLNTEYLNFSMASISNFIQFSISIFALNVTFI